MVVVDDGDVDGDLDEMMWRLGWLLCDFLCSLGFSGHVIVLYIWGSSRNLLGLTRRSRWHLIRPGHTGGAELLPPNESSLLADASPGRPFSAQGK